MDGRFETKQNKNENLRVAFLNAQSGNEAAVQVK